jgi:hypothetical protein
MLAQAGYNGITVPQPSVLASAGAIVPEPGGSLAQVPVTAMQPGDILVMHAPKQHDPGLGHEGIVTAPGPSWAFIGAQYKGIDSVDPKKGAYGDWFKAVNANHPKVYRVCLPDGSSTGTGQAASAGAPLSAAVFSNIVGWSLLDVWMGELDDSSDSNSEETAGPGSAVGITFTGCESMDGVACTGDMNGGDDGGDGGGCDDPDDCSDPPDSD